VVRLVVRSGVEGVGRQGGCRGEISREKRWEHILASGGAVVTVSDYSCTQEDNK